MSFIVGNLEDKEAVLWKITVDKATNHMKSSLDETYLI